MRVIVTRLVRAHAGETLDGVPGLAKRLQRGSAVVMGRGVLGLGRDGLVEIIDRSVMLALSRCDHTKVVRYGGMTGSRAKDVTVRRLGLIKTSGLVVRDRVRDKPVEFSPCARHVTTR